ncbi:hypothetical protein AMJ74_01535 [candidate division WOR_3 bacterium SM1_77]|uniref:Uncharacterized protein n=1 Tax=candidate division WOR_3 bacterium SM1_77 TaxID=1703778 RepID=A0A0S8K1I1_UNCW3|nr:MAG: hypothetical protein AMJ74_01535 [candidate division WOR_3 bacterium SM1_77]
MGNKPDWVGTNFKKTVRKIDDKTKMVGVKKMADGSLPDIEGGEDDFDPGFDISYSASGQDAKNFGGGGRLSRNVYHGEDGTLNLGLSGSHWKGGGQSGASLDAVDATYMTKHGDFGIQASPDLKSVKLTFRKEF